MVDHPQPSEPARINPIRAGLLCRCPNCGKGPLFEGFLKIRPVCETCGYDLASVATGDGAASFIMQIAGALVGFSALYVEIVFSPPMWLHLIVWLPLVAALSLGLMRPGKGLMTALHMKNMAREVRNDEL
ncbi:DUF983 domain-containing protein [Brevundimonas sp. BAL450]|nr:MULTISPECIES: DUF983 domain-containing protein [Brevundimonas]MBG7616313.1 DUF983 domain-containing protein [Brevundimonas sp. BAL450]